MPTREQLRDHRIVRRFARASGREQHVITSLYPLERIVSVRSWTYEQPIPALHLEEPRCDRGRMGRTAADEAHVEFEFRTGARLNERTACVEYGAANRVGALGKRAALTIR
jgi:hypothetical protein